MKEKVEVAKVYSRKKNGVVPTLMKFQNGKLSAFTKENTDFCRLRNLENKNQLAALLVANGHTYQGLINDTEANKLTDTYICVRNKTTNKMTIIPMDQVTLKNTVYDEINKKKHMDLSEEMSKKTLLNKFGGRKASRFIHEHEKMRMDIKLVQDELEATVVEADIEKVELDKNVDNTEYFNKIRPTINTEAEDISEVYKIEDIIPADLLSRLDEEAKTIYQTQIDGIPIKSEYLKKVIQTIQQSPVDNKGLLRLKIIIYMDSLLSLIKSRAKSLTKTEISKISEKIENNVRDRFSDPNASYSGARTAFSIEKAFCYFIVLSLLIDDKYQIDSAILSQELNASRVKVVKYAHIVQALPKPKSTILCLKLPKNVPALPANFTRKPKA